MLSMKRKAEGSAEDVSLDDLIAIASEESSMPEPHALVAAYERVVKKACSEQRWKEVAADSRMQRVHARTIDVISTITAPRAADFLEAYAETGSGCVELLNAATSSLAIQPDSVDASFVPSVCAALSKLTRPDSRATAGEWFARVLSGRASSLRATEAVSVARSLSVLREQSPGCVVEELCDRIRVVIDDLGADLVPLVCALALLPCKDLGLLHMLAQKVQAAYPARVSFCVRASARVRAYVWACVVCEQRARACGCVRARVRATRLRVADKCMNWQVQA